MKLLTERLKLVLTENPVLGGIKGQVGLAKAAGASKSVVNQWLDGGIKSIGIEYALCIEAALGYNHIWLMTGRGPVHTSESEKQTTPVVVDGDVRIVVDMLNSTDAEGRILAKNAVIDALTQYRRRQSEVAVLTGKISSSVSESPRGQKEISSSGS